jgi:hypothetical protein
LFSYFIIQHHFFFGEKTNVANLIVAPREEKKSTEERERLFDAQTETDRRLTDCRFDERKKFTEKKNRTTGGGGQRRRKKRSLSRKKGKNWTPFKTHLFLY